MGMLIAILYLAVLFAWIASVWVTFEKAGRPGWASLIPIYNGVVILQIAGKPWWWIFLYLIPVVNLLIAVLTMIAFAEKFGMGMGFGLGLLFLGFIFFPILAFGDARYRAATGPWIEASPWIE